jgi:putative endonuclease
VKRIGKNKSNIGILGEDIAIKWLIYKGFKLVTQNFKTYHGEIDVIAEKDGEIYFTEVKSINISRGTVGKIDPRDNFTYSKSLKMTKAIEYYLLKHSSVKEFKTLLLAIYIDESKKTAQVRYLENPILD